MPILDLSFESKEDSLSVRRFAVSEAMSSLFLVRVTARSRNDDIDLETIVGRGAALRVEHGLRFALHGARRWTGVCSEMVLLRTEGDGLSTYEIHIAPRLWLAAQGRGHRLFQHRSIPDIVGQVLDEWRVEHTWQIHRAEHPPLEMRVQYGESDFAFASRLLSEAGISYTFAEDPDHPERGSVLVLRDAPEAAEPRHGAPIPYVDEPNRSAEREFVTAVHLAQRVRPGRVTLRDHDFRRSPGFGLFGHTPPVRGVEQAIEHYAYTPGAFLTEVRREAEGELAGAAGRVAAEAGAVVERRVERLVGDTAARAVGRIAGAAAGGVAGKLAGGAAQAVVSGLHLGGVVGRLLGDDHGVARHDEHTGMDRAARLLASARASRRELALETNAIDLAPGTVFALGGHPRHDLGADRRLMVTAFSVFGGPGEEWTMKAAAVFAALPYRPPVPAEKPRITSLQSAVVVGPPGEEIHVDELGRVRVQFHWDREGAFDDRSSCWMRVSQGWAGPGFGAIALPRVGQEVLVAFLEGDPDQPVVVGRLYNATARVPYDLPTHKTRSGWRSDSSPGSGGFNEIMFEDAKGHELLRVQAERDLEEVVKHDASVSVGADRRARVGGVDETHVGVRHQVAMRHGEAAQPTSFEMIDQRIHLTTGAASLTLDGPNITLQAKGRILICSSEDDVEIVGGPWVKINCGPAGAEPDTVTTHHVTGIVRDQDGEPLARTRVIVKASDGALQQVESDAAGRYYALVPPGPCEVSVPGFRFHRRSVNLDEMNEDAERFDDSGPVR